jgi:hypothetical protein
MVVPSLGTSCSSHEVPWGPGTLRNASARCGAGLGGLGGGLAGLAGGRGLAVGVLVLGQLVVSHDRDVGVLAGRELSPEDGLVLLLVALGRVEDPVRREGAVAVLADDPDVVVAALGVVVVVAGDRHAAGPQVAVPDAADAVPLADAQLAHGGVDLLVLGLDGGLVVLQRAAAGDRRAQALLAGLVVLDDGLVGLQAGAVLTELVTGGGRELAVTGLPDVADLPAVDVVHVVDAPVGRARPRDRGVAGRQHRVDRDVLDLVGRHLGASPTVWLPLRSTTHFSPPGVSAGGW